MNDTGVQAILAKRQAVITNSHVVFKSGKHGTDYVNKDAIYPYVEDVMTICREMARVIINEGIEVDVVVGPTVGGVILSQRVAQDIMETRSLEVLSVYADKAEGGEGRILKRGYDKLVVGKRCLIVDDVMTTGGSVKETIVAVKQAGGIVVAVIVICNRGGVTASDLGVEHFYALLNLDLQAWPPAECPLCRDKVSVNIEVGHGKAFLEGR